VNYALVLILFFSLHAQPSFQHTAIDEPKYQLPTLLPTSHISQPISRQKTSDKTPQMPPIWQIYADGFAPIFIRKMSQAYPKKSNFSSPLRINTVVILGGRRNM
jgi:hypothetical protein